MRATSWRKIFTPERLRVFPSFSRNGEEIPLFPSIVRDILCSGNEGKLSGGAFIVSDYLTPILLQITCDGC